MPDKDTKYEVGEFADPHSSEAYFFFPHAVEKGILDTNELNPNNPQEAAMKIRNARVPAQAGTVALSDTELAAYDLVAARFEGDKLIIGPTHKDAVEPDSRLIVADGLLVFSMLDGHFVKVVAKAAEARKATWCNDYQRIGNRAFRFLGIEAPVFEMTDIESSFAVTKPRTPVFQIPNLLK